MDDDLPTEYDVIVVGTGKLLKNKNDYKFITKCQTFSRYD